MFSKILDSSIWLEHDATRIVWITLLAAMDEDGFAQFAAPANLAHRARVDLEKAIEAIKTLEAPDLNSSDQEFEGKRIERVPGGWMILNAKKYHDIVTRLEVQKLNRLRVAKYRSKLSNAPVTPCNGDVMQGNAKPENGNGGVMQSDTDTDTDSDTDTDTDSDTDKEEKKKLGRKASPSAFLSSDHQDFISQWCQRYEKVLGHKYKFQKSKDGAAVKRLLTMNMPVATMLAIAEGAWATPEKQLWFRDASLTIAGFDSKFNEFQAKVNPQPVWDR